MQAVSFIDIEIEFLLVYRLFAHLGAQCLDCNSQYSPFMMLFGVSQFMIFGHTCHRSVCVLVFEISLLEVVLRNSGLSNDACGDCIFNKPELYATVLVFR